MNNNHKVLLDILSESSAIYFPKWLNEIRGVKTLYNLSLITNQI